MPDGSVRKVPFLNGGLFDKDELDRQSIKHQLTFPPELFSNPAKADEDKERGFLDFLNAYNFTVHEAGPEEQTLAVDPEMLGHIFENLLEDNKDKGAFYTPKEIVHYMCQESLTQYLTNYITKTCGVDVVDAQLGRIRAKRNENSIDLEGLVRELIKDEVWSDLDSWCAPELIRALRDVKVCDPAIGSGAFPMGMLHEIHKAANTLQELRQDEVPQVWGLEQWEPAEVKLRIIQHSIYGVDIERGAVDIARLRFWLSIIVDERAPRTLPNLDYKIVVGDSLLGKFHPGDSTKAEVFQLDWDLKGNTDRVNEMRDLIKRLGEKERIFFFDPEEDKATLKREITALKIQLLTKQLEMHRDKFKARMLSTSRIGEMTAKEKVRAAEEKLQLASYEEKLGRLRSLAKGSAEHLDYFDWKLDFPEVLNGNVSKDPGFDVVIGNPPYVSHDKIAVADGSALKMGYACFEPFADLFCYFTEKAINLQKSTGVICYITSNSYLRSEYGAPLRRYIAKTNDVLFLLNVEDSQVFDSAIVNVAILIGTRNRTNGTARILNSPITDVPPNLSNVLQRAGFEYAQKAFERRSWSLSEPEAIEALTQIEASGPTLEARGTKIRLGLATGNNDAFLISGEQRANLINHNKRNAEIIKPILRGRDINRYHYSEPEQFILLTTNGINVQEDYPDIYKHFDSFGDAFKNRGAKGRHWTNLRACAFIEDFAKPKIVWIELADVGRFALSNDEVYLVNSAYFLLPPHGLPVLYLLALLNSSTIRFYLLNTAETSGMGTTRWINNYVKEFPIPNYTNGLGALLESKAEKRLATQPGPAATALETEIDVLVCKLYGLSWEQAKVVDPGLALSKEEYDAIELPESEGPDQNGSTVNEPGAGYNTGLFAEGGLFASPAEDAKPPDTPKNVGSAPKSAGDNGTANEAILAYLRTHPGLHGKSAILQATGVDAGLWNAAIKELLEAGKVVKEGEKKGARYRVKN